MIHTGAVLGTLFLTVMFMIIRVKTGWHNGFGPALASLSLALTIALIVSKTTLVKKTATFPIRFREVLITVSLIFGMIAASAFINYIQIETFGKSYDTTLGAQPERGSPIGEPSQGVVLNATKTIIDVIEEEISFRWVILGILLAITSPTSALFISSVIFAGSHLVVPVLRGNIEPGLLALLPTFTIGLFCGIAFLRHGIIGSITLHAVLNLCVMLSQRGGIYRDIAVGIILFFAVITLIVLPITLWFTRKAPGIKLASQKHKDYCA